MFYKAPVLYWREQADYSQQLAEIFPTLVPDLGQEVQFDLNKVLVSRNLYWLIILMHVVYFMTEYVEL